VGAIYGGTGGGPMSELSARSERQSRRGAGGRTLPAAVLPYHSYVPDRHDRGHPLG